MRSFIAIDLPEDVRDYLYNFQSKLKQLPAKIKWIEKKNLHLTIKFLGEIDDKKLLEIKEILSRIHYNSFEANLSNLGFFPDENHVNVIWVGIEPINQVIGLQQKIDSELLNLFSKNQKFSSHVTLGRVKFVKIKNKFLGMLKEQKIERTKFKIDSFRLYKSILMKDGPIYEVLEEYRLL